MIPHHYSHFVFDLVNGKKTTVEIGTKHLSANRNNDLTKEYHKFGLDVKWIVLGETDIPQRES